jgi:hypothetical protein
MNSLQEWDRVPPPADLCGNPQVEVGNRLGGGNLEGFGTTLAGCATAGQSGIGSVGHSEYAGALTVNKYTPRVEGNEPRRVITCSHSDLELIRNIRELRRECSAGLQTDCTGGVHAARRRHVGLETHRTADPEAGATNLWIGSYSS